MSTKTTTRVTRASAAFVAFMLAAATAGAAIVVSATPAHAATNQPSQDAGSYSDSASGTVTWLGNIDYNGVQYYCAGQTGLSWGTSAYGAETWYDGSQGDSWTGSNSSTTAITSAPAAPRQSGADLNVANTSTVSQSGVTLTGDNLNRIGYVLAKYGPTNDDVQARNVRLLTMEKFRVLYNGVYAYYLKGTGSSATRRAQIDAMWNDAIANAGPYTTADAVVDVNVDGQGGTFEGIGFRSDAGNLQSGYTWTATILSGNVTWDANGSSSLTGSSSTSLQSADFSVISGGSGTVVIGLTFANVPDWQVGVREAPLSSQQDIMRGRNFSFAALATSDLPVADTFQIEINTTTSDAVAAPGTALTDELEVSLFFGLWEPADHPITVTSTLYGPFDSAPVPGATVPGGAPVVGSVNTVVTAPGTYTTPSITVSTAGYYVWHETSPAEADVVNAWSASWAPAAEVSLIQWSPTATTALDSPTAVRGTTLTDTATFTGGQPGASTNVTFDLYLHDQAIAPTEVGSIPAGATLLDSDSGSITFNGAGEATLDANFAISASADAGFVTVVVTIDGTATMNTWTSNYGIASETAVIQWDPASSTAATRASGNVFNDEVTISGLPDDYGVMSDEGNDVLVEMFFVDERFSGVLADQCVSANLIGSETIAPRNGVWDVTGSSFDLPDFATPGMNGTYLFLHSYAGSTRVPAFAGVCGELTETLALRLTDFNPFLADTGPAGIGELEAFETLGVAGLIVAIGIGFTFGASRMRRRQIQTIPAYLG